MRLFFILLFLCSVTFIKAQDLLVTTKGDSLNCKITKLKEDRIYYAFRQGGSIQSNVIPRSEVDYFQQGYYSGEEKEKSPGYPMFRVNLTGGLSFLSGKMSLDIPSGLVDHMIELRTGYHLGAEADFYILKNFAVGIKYNVYKTKNVLDNVIVRNSSNRKMVEGKVIDDITMHYIGPSFSGKIPVFNNRIHIIPALSVGYITYKNEATFISEFMMESNTMGFITELGVDFNVTKNVGIGISGAFTGVAINKYEVYNVGSRFRDVIYLFEAENMSHFDVSLGLKFYL